jgi:CHAT domain-containing protein
MLQYHSSDDQLIAWAVRRHGVRVVRQDTGTSQLAADIRRFHRAAADSASTPAEREAIGARLVELLVAPFADELDASERVVIVPHGDLAVLPFHILSVDGEDLAATHTVSYLPAASILARRAPGWRVRLDTDALVVGDPAYAPERRLARLPGAATEAVAVSELRGGEALLNATAARRAVLDRLGTAHVVHLATHGVLKGGAPYSAELALAGVETLTVPDLVATDTTIDLAVLSACDSGRGQATASGDVIGLTRALIAAGAQELIVSLWPVDDQIACLTMVKFHDLLGRLPPAEALVGAQRSVRAMTRVAADEEYASMQARTATSGVGDRRTARDAVPQGRSTRTPSDDPSHPAYWAPFVHVGA